jgi:tetratricopeptide (TPR) repeat protein
MTVMNQLNTLESAGLIRLAQFEPDLEYLFRHTLVQDAAYATLLTTDRKRLHQVVGEAIEHLYPDRLNEYSAMLARHFEQAGNDQHALEYFSRAGDTALASYANQEAESHYLSALALVCSDPQRALLLYGLGEALYRQSRFDSAIQTWREGIELYHVLGDLDGVARLYARSARAAWYGGDQPKVRSPAPRKAQTRPGCCTKQAALITSTAFQTRLCPSASKLWTWQNALVPSMSKLTPSPHSGRLPASPTTSRWQS